MCSRLTIAGLTFAVLAMGARAADFRVWLAQQSDWDGKKGFTLSLENTASTDPLPLNTMRLVLSVADGSQWRFLEKTPAWELDRDYTLKAVVAQDKAQLFVDGTLMGESAGAFVPATGKAESFRTPGFANSAAAYLVIEKSLVLSDGSGKRTAAKWPDSNAISPALRLFEPQSPKSLDWTAGHDVTATAVVRFTARPDLRTKAPFVDRYGQAIRARFSGKVRNDADLRSSITDEAKHTKNWTPPSNRDRFGGDTEAAWTETATGYFTVANRSGFWWLVSPEGNPLFYVCLCTLDKAAWERTPVTGREFLFAELPPKVAPFDAAWARNPWGWSDNVDYVSFYTANLARKYGPDWPAKAAPLMKDRLAKWGFAGAGKWGDGSLTETPNIAVIYHSGVPNVSQHPDVFEEAVRTAFRENLRRQIEPRKTDPWLVGWSVGNEHDEIILKTEVADILTKPAGTPAKRALIDYAVDHVYGGKAEAAAAAWQCKASTRDELYAATPKPGDADVEAMRRFYADRYYAFIYDAVKAADPNHLYLGFWILPWWWENEEDWSLIAAHCDVIGYDRYAETFSDANLDRWMAKAGKPVLCGEFSFPPFYDGRRGMGLYTAVSTRDDRDAARHYDTWVRAAARNPFCIGVSYFQYRDQPITGRGPGGGANLVADEHYAFGLVDITDRPKWDFIDTVRAANLAAPGIRRASTSAAAESAGIERAQG
jgi:hypothetical protein